MRYALRGMAVPMPLQSTINQFKIQNSKLKTATHKGWGFYLGTSNFLNTQSICSASVSLALEQQRARLRRERSVERCSHYGNMGNLFFVSPLPCETRIFSPTRGEVLNLTFSNKSVPHQVAICCMFSVGALCCATTL